MKAYLETISKAPQQSLTVFDRRLDDGIPFEWHQHPEYELTLTLNSQGHRYVGDSIAPYEDNDLVLVGPNTPHTWHSDSAPMSSKPHNALVVWFSEAWLRQLVTLCPEWSNLQHLIERARGALCFSNQTGAAIRSDLQALIEAEPKQRLLTFVQILQTLSSDTEAHPLCRHFLHTPPDDRLQPIIDRLNREYANPPSAAELAAMTHLSVSSFQRLFQRHTHLSPSQYIARLRIGQACSQLISSHTHISIIAQQVGYQSLAQFNKTFKALKGLTPRQFRAQFRAR